MPKMTPVNLSVEGVHAAAGPGEAVGLVYGLHAIADGATLAHALDKLDVDDPDISQAVKAVYQNAIGEDDQRVPSQLQQQNARDQLHGFHLSRNWFRGRSGPDQP